MIPFCAMVCHYEIAMPSLYTWEGKRVSLLFSLNWGSRYKLHQVVCLLGFVETKLVVLGISLYLLRPVAYRSLTHLHIIGGYRLSFMLLMTFL